jgi:hypothetical protein
VNRTLLLGAAWIASAAGAVGLGFLAVSLVDASASPSFQGASSSAAETGSGSSASSTTAAAVPSGEQSTVGGTVFASCAGGSAVPVLSGAPAPGWWADDSQQPGQFEFKSSTQSIEVRATCVGGAPQFSVEGPRTESGGGDRTPSTPAAPSTASSDDPPGDDHGGGSNSGSGSSGGGGGGGGGHGSDG